MSSAAVCWICLDPEPDSPGGPYHTTCATALFGSPSAPAIAFDFLAVNGWAEEHSGRLSISGFQPKAPAALSQDGQSLILVESDSTHIVKPQHVQHLHIPQNEHLTMRLGRLGGLDVAEHGLIELSDGAIAYLTRRFDRPHQSGPRLHVVDFCQLADLPPEDKESSTTEQCGELALKYAAPGTAARLFQLFVFAYWVRNGDLHLKNLMLARRADGSYGLAPAYDLLCTEPYNVKGMMLPVAGERMNIPRHTWIEVGCSSFGLSASEAASTIDTLIGHLPAAEQLVERSLLPNQEWKHNYVRFLRKRTRQLAGEV
ncbi:MAG: HipA domain-containing protein [Polyangiaceae bacterium]